LHPDTVRNSDANAHGHPKPDTYCNSHTDIDTDTDTDTNSYSHAHSYADCNTYRKPNLHAKFVPGADSVFRYRRAAEHAAKPDTGRTGCDCGGPVRRLFRHAHAGAVNTVQHRRGLLQQRV